MVDASALWIKVFIEQMSLEVTFEGAAARSMESRCDVSSDGIEFIINYTNY